MRSMERMLEPSESVAMIAICLSVLSTFAIKPHWNNCTPTIRECQSICGVQFVYYAEAFGDTRYIRSTGNG